MMIITNTIHCVRLPQVINMLVIAIIKSTMINKVVIVFGTKMIGDVCCKMIIFFLLYMVVA